MTSQNHHIRWMIRRDMPTVYRIERESFENPWDEDDFIQCLRRRNCFGMIAEDDCEQLSGYMIYELHKARLHLLHLAADPARRRNRVGTALVDKLKSKLRADGRNRILCEVRDTNLDAQLFFRELGFRAISVLRNFEDTGEDAYLMEYRIEPTDEQVRHSVGNRISRHLQST